MTDFFAPPAAPAHRPLRVAVIGAGWAGLAAAVRASQLGHQVQVLEATRQPGGRARSLPLSLPDGRTVLVDNGQHILIGAYTACLALMRLLGVDPAQALLRQPLHLQYPDGSGLRLPAGRWPPALAAAWGMLRARGWAWGERLALLARAARWRAQGFACPAHTSVADLCAGLPPRVLQDFMAPLCISALNTPLHQASGQTFLRVLQDALLGPPGGADVLLPRGDLGALLPQPALHWLQQRGARVQLGQRVPALHAPHASSGQWRLGDEVPDAGGFDRVILATAAPHASHILRASTGLPASTQDWCARAEALQHTAITTVYAQVEDFDGRAAPLLPSAMLALRDGPQAPAQFVFERDAMGPHAAPSGLLAFVISTSSGSAEALAQAVTQQARAQLGLPVRVLRTVTEKRATFASTCGLQRPPQHIAPGLLACGDYVQGPYPATLEGAVRSGQQAADALRQG